MNKDFMVSVIMPIYNVEKYLERSILSVIKQTYKNMEIILVNDGSTDNSLKICEKYKEKDSRILVINKENGGLSSARNAGLDIARGDYIVLIDSDDFIEEHFIEYLLDVATMYNTDIAECSLEKVNEEQLYEVDFKFNNDRKITVLNNFEALKRIHSDNFDECLRSVVVWNKIYKRKLFDGIRYPEGKQYEDEFTTYKLFYKSKKIAFSNEKLYAYVQRKNSIMKQSFNIKRLDAIEAYDAYLDFFEEKNLYDMQARTCRRYMRILTIIKDEVINSDYKEKDNILTILYNRMDKICKKLDELLLNHKELEYRKNLHQEFVKKFYN